MKKIGNTNVPRNPYAVAAQQKKAGKHEPNHKAVRQKLQKKIRDELSLAQTSQKSKRIDED